MRPTARYLQQHCFVVNQRLAQASCLISLINQVGEVLFISTPPHGPVCLTFSAPHLYNDVIDVMYKGGEFGGGELRASKCVGRGGGACALGFVLFACPGVIGMVDAVG
jgi:hypothetical protein